MVKKSSKDTKSPFVMIRDQAGEAKFVRNKYFDQKKGMSDVSATYYLICM